MTYSITDLLNFQFAKQEELKEHVSVIEKHLVNNGGGNYNDFYVGITKDPEQCLFTRHNISRYNHCYIARKTTSDTVSREVEKYFIGKGMSGGSGGGDWQSVYVYVYKKDWFTNESADNNSLLKLFGY